MISTIRRIIITAADLFLVACGVSAAEGMDCCEMTVGDSAACDSSCVVVKKRPLRAAALVVGMNTGLWLYDRYVRKDDWFKISGKTIKNNFDNGFNWDWDYDRFVTNLFGHPYNGNLYYNAARSNGMNYWVSTAYALGGSLTWEYFSEAQHPSANDIISTTIGGSAIGEATHRISEGVLDDSKRGAERVGREVLALLINPIGGLNRLLNGDSWRVRSPRNGNGGRPSAFDLSVGAYGGTLYEGTGLMRGDAYFGINLNCSYGNFLDRSKKPYEAFRMKSSLCLDGSQPLVGKLDIIGDLVTGVRKGKGDWRTTYGIYQYFDYFNSKKTGADDRPSVELAQIASFGPGIVVGTDGDRCSWRIEEGIFTGAVILGGCKSDHFRYGDRDYNMGSGFSVRSTTRVAYRHAVDIGLDVMDINLYTWKGGTVEELRDKKVENIQGDRGHASMMVLNPSIEVFVSHRLSLSLEAYYFLRRSYYKDYDHVWARVTDTQLSFAYHL